eukprot:GFYU01002853.1.p1 GENE.GFYU01002853.1~~GFYU01002853.1.p1  ORF type:complete len:119 (+),score=17.20 GFYU01002853.1:160-516(+)
MMEPSVFARPPRPSVFTMWWLHHGSSTVDHMEETRSTDLYPHSGLPHSDQFTPFDQLSDAGSVDSQVSIDRDDTISEDNFIALHPRRRSASLGDESALWKQLACTIDTRCADGEVMST